MQKKKKKKKWSNYKQQQNYCSNLLKETNTRHFNNLDVKDVTKNNRFWKIKTTFFTDKTKSSNNIILTENYQTIREDLTSVKKDLKLQQVDQTQTFKNEESCRLIKKHFGNGSFFKPVSKNGIIGPIKKSPPSKASNSNNTPVSVMKQYANCYCETYKYFERLYQRKVFQI